MTAVATLACSKCRQRKADQEFPPDARCTRRRGRGSWCRGCNARRQREYVARNPDRVRRATRRYHLRAKYGIAPEDYAEMLAAQGGVCAICALPEAHSTWPAGEPRLAVDHDHATNRLRGLLCSHCNTALGKFRDDPDRLRAAIRYLEDC